MTTVVAERAAVFTDTALEKHPYFSWGAAFAGAFAGAMVAFTLLAIGAGLGLVFVGPVAESTTPVKTILTLGGIYFFAVEAFGFAVGGYLAGRLCGPVLQSRGEEMFRSAAHGLVVWALISASSLVFLTIGAAVAAGAAGTTAAVLGVGSAKGPGDEVAPALTAYWADTLLRVPAGPTAMTTPLPATVPTESATDPTEPSSDTAPAPAPDSSTMPPQESAPAEGETETAPPNSGEAPNDTGDQSQSAPNDEEVPPPAPSPAVYVPDGRSLLLRRIQYAEPNVAPQITTIAPSRRVDSDARAEIARILAANAIALDKMPAEDRRYIERTIVEQTGLSQADARQRIDGLIVRVKTERTKVAEAARKAGAYIHIWLGLSLFFGLLVATGAAVLARLEDDDKTEAKVVRVEPAAPV